jgi:hypothetical protein
MGMNTQRLWGYIGRTRRKQSRETFLREATEAAYSVLLSVGWICCWTDDACALG